MSISFWRNRPTLVTGASGFLGSWLVKGLLEAGAELVCLVRDWTPHSEFSRSRLIARVNVVWGDICDQALVERVLGEYEVDTVFHLAAQTIVTIANHNPLSTYASNIQGTWAVLEACRRSPMVKQIVVASSDKAYGAHSHLPYEETMPLHGEHPYDVSKSCSDLIAQSYARTFHLPVAITRFGNLFGGGDLHWNRIIPGVIRAIWNGHPPIIRSDGNYIRDYFYVEDGAAAYMSLAEHLADTPSLKGEAFNFSYENPISVLALVQSILALMKADLKPLILNEANHEIRDQYLSAQKALRVLGWVPRFTLEEGLQKTIQWYQEFLENEGKGERPESENLRIGSGVLFGGVFPGRL